MDQSPIHSDQKQLQNDYRIVLNELSSVKLDSDQLHENWKVNERKLKEMREKNSKLEKKLVELEKENASQFSTYEEEMSERIFSAKNELKTLKCERVSLQTYLKRLKDQNERYRAEIARKSVQSNRNRSVPDISANTVNINPFVIKATIARFRFNAAKKCKEDRTLDGYSGLPPLISRSKSRSSSIYSHDRLVPTQSAR